MKYSYNWLKELSGTKKTAEKIAELLTMKAFEVESIDDLGKGFSGVVVGEILEIKKHPNADRLKVTKTSIEKKTLIIVCGAPNINIGDKVPVATVGTKLPNGMEIKEAEIRGVKSFGMICAEDELNLGKDHSGILILNPKAKVGTPLAKELGLDDKVIEIKVLPDRNHDALSHLGMAREICALEGRKLKYKSGKFPKTVKAQSLFNDLNIKIEDKKSCSRYIGAVMGDIEIKESPEWMKKRLEVLEFRPINNVVDATNYVMLETGQPLHAFDYDVVKNESAALKNKNQASIIIRKAKNGETIKLLDGSVKGLSNNDLVITNDKKVLAIAGVMGGENSGVSPNTKKIIIESAAFDAFSVRKTKNRLNISTDAAFRYEKGIDPNMTEVAMARVMEIIGSAGGKMEKIVDVYPEKIKPWKIKLDPDYANKLLGINIPAKDVTKILKCLEIGTKKIGKNNFFEATIPTFRLDMKTQEDLIEDIGRIYGYDKIELQAPIMRLEPGRANENRIFERAVKNILVGKGFSEIYNYSFYGKQDANLAQLGMVEHLELENPINPEQSLLRVSLIPSLLKNIRENLKNYGHFNIFEIGRIYSRNKNYLSGEKQMLVGAVVLEKDRKADSFFETKGIVDILLKSLRITDYYYDNFNPVPMDAFGALWHGRRSAEIKIEGEGKIIGYFGEINPLILSEFDIHRRVAMFEFDMGKFRCLCEGECEYRPIGRYPVAMRDISLVIKGNIRVDDILEIIQSAGGNLMLDVDLFDIYDFKDGSSSYAFHIIFGADDRTLENKEVDSLMKGIIIELEKNIEIKVRK